MQTHVLKEVVDDLEWPGASVNVKIGRTPDRLGFEAQGVDVGKLEVRLVASRPSSCVWFLLDSK